MGVTISPTSDPVLVVGLTIDAWRSSVDFRSSGHRFEVDDVRRLFDEGAVALVASDAEGEPIGSVIVVPDGTETMELTKLAVPDLGIRQSGVGSALVEAAASTAVTMGFTELVLAVSLFQPQLCKYYARRGFVASPARTYRHASPHSPPPIVMFRPLDASTPPDPLGDAADALLDGGLVILPTETVYGLGALASDPIAVRRVFATKGRPVDHPLIVHVANRAAISYWAVDIPDSAWKLAERLWPGPLTLVLNKAGWVPPEVTGGLDTVALRVPRHKEALAILGLLPENSGIAAPSANRFGKVSPTTAADAHNDLAPFLMSGDLVVDGGPCGLGVESTILDLTTPVPTILRPGGCTAEEIEEVLGSPVERVASGPSRAPGMLAAHYAPMAGVLVIDEGRVVANATAAVAEGKSVGLLAPKGSVSTMAGVVCLDAPVPYTGETLAPVLYARLREADRLGLDLLLVVAPNEEGLGVAVNDRLRRAETGSRRS